jgi:hypothetical protein
MKTSTKSSKMFRRLAIALAVLTFPNYIYAQVQGPNHGLSSTVIANHSDTWENVSNIFQADGRYATVTLGVGQVSDTLEIGNFHLNVPEDAVVEGITVAIGKGASGIGIVDNTVKLVSNGVVCGEEHASNEEWSTDPAISMYGSDGDKWGLNLTPGMVNSYSFGVALCVSNSLYGISMNKANIDYITITINYKKPDQLGLVDFTASYDENEVRLDWTMASQTECSSFSIERSSDGINQEVIGNAPGDVNADHPTSYSFTDNSPLFGTSYYRIQSKNADGTIQDFNWVAVATDEKNSSVVLYPNPTGDKITVKFPSVGEPSILMIMDQKGRVLLSETVPVFANMNSTTYIQDVSVLSPGMYIVLVNNGNKDYTNRFVKK